MPTRSPALLRSAGAVAHRPGRDTVEILLVHRPKYDDWSLPKGHLDGDESYETAAIRELEEEAGVRGGLGPLVGSIGYPVQGQPKVVRYWLVAAESGRFRPNAEVDEVAWVSPDQAVQLTSQAADRAVVTVALRRLERPRSALVHLLRHSAAGSRDGWRGDDEKRPLSAFGRRQARVITTRLTQSPVTHIFSSSYRRCEETVAPLAHALDMSVEVEKPLTEGQPPEQLLDLLGDLEGTSSVMSSHGDIISGVVGMLASQGVELDGPLEWKKGSVWELDLLNGRVRAARYVPPPRL